MWNYVPLAEHCNTLFLEVVFFLNLPKVVSESKQIASTAEFNIYCAEQRDPKYAHKSRKNLFE